MMGRFFAFTRKMSSVKYVPRFVFLLLLPGPRELSSAIDPSIESRPDPNGVPFKYAPPVFANIGNAPRHFGSHGACSI